MTSTSSTRARRTTRSASSVAYATQRPLYDYKPDDAEKPSRTWPRATPEISEDGKTVTVKIKKGVKFSPPVNREVTSKDVKYAIERGFFNTVNNGYAGAYFGDVEGAEGRRQAGHEDLGHRDAGRPRRSCSTLEAAPAACWPARSALPLPPRCRRSTPRSSTRRTRRRTAQNQVATGPYMIENNAAGKAIGYEAGKRIHLVRNPNWDKSTDYRPAYLDEIDMPQGNDDTDGRVAQDPRGQRLITGDFTPPPADPEAGADAQQGPAPARSRPVVTRWVVA